MRTARERQMVTYLFIAGNAMLGGSSLQSPLQTGHPAGSGMQRHSPGRYVEKDLVADFSKRTASYSQGGPLQFLLHFYQGTLQ